MSNQPTGEFYCSLHKYPYTCQCEPITEKDLATAKFINLMYDEDEKKKFQRRNLLARMSGNIAAGLAIDAANGDVSIEEVADYSVRIAKAILGELDKEG